MNRSFTFIIVIFSFFISTHLNKFDIFFYKTEFDFPEHQIVLYPLYPSLSAPSALVAEVSTGKIILAKNEKEVRPIASITKIVTALTILKSNLPLDEEIEILEEDIDTLKGSTSHIPTGAIFTRSELLNLALMSSENRAALALARTSKGGTYFFKRDMNRICKALNANDSYFVDPAGLSPMNVSSCIDLFKLARAAYCKEIIRDFSTRDDILFKSIKGKFKRYFGNTNSFTVNKEYHIKLSKTGYILESGRCILLVFEIKGKDYIVILLGEKTVGARDKDIELIRKWLLEVVK